MSCIGQGPIVHVRSPQLDFGRIPVLTDITRTLRLSNQSPIPAHFTARMVQTIAKKGSPLNTHTVLAVLGRHEHTKKQFLLKFKLR